MDFFIPRMQQSLYVPTSAHGSSWLNRQQVSDCWSGPAVHTVCCLAAFGGPRGFSVLCTQPSTSLCTGKHELLTAGEKIPTNGENDDSPYLLSVSLVRRRSKGFLPHIISFNPFNHPKVSAHFKDTEIFVTLISLMTTRTNGETYEGQVHAHGTPRAAEAGAEARSGRLRVCAPSPCAHLLCEENTIQDMTASPPCKPTFLSPNSVSPDMFGSLYKLTSPTDYYCHFH